MFNVTKLLTQTKWDLTEALFLFLTVNMMVHGRFQDRIKINRDLKLGKTLQ